MNASFVLATVASKKVLFPVEIVDEVLPMLALQETGAGGNFRGVFNLRGIPIAAYDLAGPEARIHADRLIVVTKLFQEPIGFIVDSIDDVMQFEPSQICERTVENNRRIRVVNVEDCFIPVVQPAEVVQYAF